MNYEKVIELNALLGIIKNTGLSVDSLLGVIKLRAKAKRICSEFDEAVTGIMEQYGITATAEGKYPFGTHASAAEIRQKIRDLEKSEVGEELGNLNFLTPKELHASTAGESSALIGDAAVLLLKLD